MGKGVFRCQAVEYQATFGVGSPDQLGNDTPVHLRTAQHPGAAGKVQQDTIGRQVAWNDPVCFTMLEIIALDRHIPGVG
jgi:hypothetical protein